MRAAPRVLAPAARLDINAVMLATSLAPDGYLGPP
jgi:hypothetical protein